MKFISPIYSLLVGNLIFAAPQVRAATLTWDGNGAVAGLTDASGTWLGVDPWWNGTTNVGWTSGDSAIFGNGGTGGAVTLASPTTVDSLTFNSFSGTYTLGSIGQTITLNNGVTMNSGAGGVNIISSITLGAVQTWLNNSSSLFSVDGAVTNGGFQLTIAGSGNIALSGIISGSGGLTKSGDGVATVSGNSTASFLGALNVDGGTLTLSGNGEMAGTSGVAIGNRATLTLDNSVSNLGNRTAGAITSSGGTINFIGNAAATTETIGALTLNAGALTINSTAGAGGSTLTIPSITRSVVGGTLYLNNNTGANVVLGTAPTLVNNILKYMVVTNGAGLTSFATYSTSGGTNQTVVPLPISSHTAAEANWTGATVNARPTADVAMTNDRTVYTLTLDSGIDLLTPAGDRTLTLSGGVLQTGGTSVIQGGTRDNILAFGTNEALFHVLGTLQLDRDNANTLTGTAGLTKSGAGTLILNGRSTLTIATAGSAVNINEGILELRLDRALQSTAITNNLNGATLRLSNNADTAFTGNWKVNADSTIEVDRVTPAATATTHTTGTLSIGGGRTLSVKANDITSGTAYGLILGDTTFTGNATFNVANNGVGIGTLTLGAMNDGGAGRTITKQGSGSLTWGAITLSGAHEWENDGAGTLTAGTVTAGARTLTLSGTGNGLATLTGGLSFSGAGGLVIGKSGTLGTTISGGTITLGGTGGITINSGSSAVRLGVATISAIQNWANNSSTAMTTTGILTINSQLSLTAGTFALGNFANTGAGGVVVNGATAWAQAGNAAAFGTGTLTLTSGTVSSDGGTARIFTNNLVINGSGTLGDATNNGLLTFSSGTKTFTGSNTITLGSAVTFSTNALLLAAGSNTTFSSASSALVISGGLNSNSGTDTLTFNTGANAVTMSGALAGTGRFILAGSGTNITVGAMTGTANAFEVNSTTGGEYSFNGASTFTGGVTLTSGKLNINANGVVGTNGPLGNGGAFIINGGTIDNTSGAARVVANVNPITLGGDFAFSTSAGTASNNLTLPGTVALGGQTRMITTDGAGVLTLGGAISNGGLTKAGTGVLALTGANTFTGTTTISDGTLRLNRSAANNTTLLTDGNTATASDIVINGGTLQIAVSEQIANTGSINMSSGAFNFGAASGLTETIDKFTNSGGTFVTGANTLDVLGATVTWSGGTNTISSGGAVRDKHVVVTDGTNTVNAGGELELKTGGGTAGLFFGGTASPTITLDSSAGTAGKITLNQDVTVDSTLTSGTARILNGGALANAGFIDMVGATRTFTVNNGSAATDMLVSAQLTNGGLTKDGAGRLSLTGINTYTGATTVSGGILGLEGSGTINTTSGITVAAGATLLYSSSTALTVAPTLSGAGTGSRAILGGNGTINAALTTLNDLGDVLSPGATATSSLGVLTFSTGQTWASNSYDWEINDWAASVAGTNIDKIEVTGVLDLSATSADSYDLNILSLKNDETSGLVGAGGGAPFTETTKSWTIITASGGITGFAASEWNLSAAGFLDGEAGAWSLSQNVNDLVLTYTAIPEPRAALLGGLGLLLILRRRR